LNSQGKILWTYVWVKKNYPSLFYKCGSCKYFLFLNLIIYHLLNFIYKIRYLHHCCIELGNNDAYGLIDPHFTLGQNEHGRVRSYIQKKLCDDNKDCYLTPYFNKYFFILVIVNHL
jgi:hypothetical protein